MNKSTILVFGQSGQVAKELQQLNSDALYLARADADLSDPKSCYNWISEVCPKAVINAAAYTAVDRAELEVRLANVVNCKAPAMMAEACKALNIPLVHISTDYVFDGAGYRAFSPTDKTNPSSAYGKSKLLGENAIISLSPIYAVLRTSWVFSRFGTNFVKSIVRNARQNETLSVVCNEIGGPTPAKAVAHACLVLANELIRDPAKSGIYHLAGTPDISRADFARKIISMASLDCSVTNIPSNDFPTNAKRPLNSRLECGSLSEIGLTQPRWESELAAVVEHIRLHECALEKDIE